MSRKQLAARAQGVQAAAGVWGSDTSLPKKKRGEPQHDLSSCSRPHSGSTRPWPSPPSSPASSRASCLAPRSLDLSFQPETWGAPQPCTCKKKAGNEEVLRLQDLDTVTPVGSLRSPGPWVWSQGGKQRGHTSRRPQRCSRPPSRPPLSIQDTPCVGLGGTGLSQRTQQITVMPPWNLNFNAGDIQ